MQCFGYSDFENFDIVSDVRISIFGFNLSVIQKIIANNICVNTPIL